MGVAHAGKSLRRSCGAHAPCHAATTPQGTAAAMRLHLDQSPIKLPFRHPSPPSTHKHTLQNTSQGLGLALCRALAAHGCRELVVVSRSGSLPEPVQRDFARCGVHVTALSVDLSDRDAARKLFDGIARDMPSIRHVIHAAGVSQPELVEALEPAAFWVGAGAKVSAARTWLCCAWLFSLFHPGLQLHATVNDTRKCMRR